MDFSDAIIPLLDLAKMDPTGHSNKYAIYLATNFLDLQSSEPASELAAINQQLPLIMKWVQTINNSGATKSSRGDGDSRLPVVSSTFGQLIKTSSDYYTSLLLSYPGHIFLRKTGFFSERQHFPPRGKIFLRANFVQSQKFQSNLDFS